MLPTESHKIYIKIYNSIKQNENLNLKFSNSCSWQGLVIVSLQLEQSVTFVHDTKTVTPFEVHCLSKCDLVLMPHFN